MSFADRNQLAQESETYVQHELYLRGWETHKLRPTFPKWLNDMLSEYEDSNFRPCHLRWPPDFIIGRRGDPQSLRAVDVKRSRNGLLHIERRALLTYVEWEDVQHLPVIVVFHCPQFDAPEDLRAIAAGKALLNAIPHHGVHGEHSSGTPYFDVDRESTSPMERFFGPKRSAK